MRGMTRGASKTPAGKTTALHQPQRLKTNILRLIVAHWGLHPVTRAAELHLGLCREPSWIQRLAVPQRVLPGSRMAALTLNAGYYGFETGADLRRVASQAGCQIVNILFQAKGRFRIGRSGCVCPTVMPY